MTQPESKGDAPGKNIVLCGFMGSGKTTLGRILSRRMGYSFVDVDDYIVERSGMPIPRIFSEFGEEGFREREHQAIRELCGRKGNIVATGGGAMTFPRNVRLLRCDGVVLYLNPGFETCWQRIRSSDRPLVRSNTMHQLEELYRARQELYRAACHLELTMEGSPAQWVDSMERLVRSFQG